MSNPADYRREVTKASYGPGFPHCPCCRIQSSLKETLTLNNRRIRRRLKRELRNGDM